MSLTKFELLLVLQMNAKDVKEIGQFLTGQGDPEMIDINSLFILLVLTNANLTLAQKIENILNFIAFDSKEAGGQGMVGLDELKYIFQIGYQLLNRITDLDLINNPQIVNEKDLNSSYGSQVEFDLVEALYGPEKPDRPDSVEISSVINVTVS